MVSDPNVEQNNTHDGNKNTLTLAPPPVNNTTPATSTLASKTNHDENSHNEDSNSSNQSGDDTSTTAYSGSRCTTSRTTVNEDMVSRGEEEGVPSSHKHCSHLPRTRQDHREHVNQALNDLRTSINAALLSAPLIADESVASVGNDPFPSVGEGTVPDDRFNRINEENNKADPAIDASRVELVNQASSIIREISRDNMRLRQEIGEMIAGRQSSLTWELQQQSGSDNAS